MLLFQGLVGLDETATELGQVSLQVTGIDAANAATARLGYHALEGDAHLGNPAQDPPGAGISPPCANCFDFVSVNGTKLTGSPGNTQPNNLMNASTGAGTDIDVFDISPLVKAGDKSMTVVASSGDGIVDKADNEAVVAGSGELFYLGYMVVSVQRKSP